jgi:hypothetical protein
MRLTIHRGSHEIGGTCVELATGATRIVLDAGLPLVTASCGGEGAALPKSPTRPCRPAARLSFHPPRFFSLLPGGGKSVR